MDKISNSIFEPGEVLVASDVKYENYYMCGFGVVIKLFDIKEQYEIFKMTEVDIDGFNFILWLVKENFVMPIDYRQINVDEL